MERMSRTKVDQGRQTHQVLQSTPLDLIETGKSLRVQAERPHLVSLGSGRLSTAITLLPLQEGRTTLGSGGTDIPLQGPGIAATHCYIENQAGSITLYPCGNQCLVDGLPITKPYRLSQGCMLCFGQSAFFRFNHPEEALRMKSMLPGGSQGLSSTKSHPNGKNSALAFRELITSRLNSSHGVMFRVSACRFLVSTYVGYRNKLVNTSCVLEGYTVSSVVTLGSENVCSDCHRRLPILCIKIKKFFLLNRRK
uniref:FHA domain-containing protein n=1 Tax=Labrus bergylta TaxID=56723 RepID=A0A3Q3NFI4_9LABR